MGWTGSIPGRLGRPYALVTDESRDWRFDLGIGNEAPKEFREPLLLDILKECIRESLSAIDDLVAGISIDPGWLSISGIGRVWLNFLAEPLLLIF